MKLTILYSMNGSFLIYDTIFNLILLIIYTRIDLHKRRILIVMISYIKYCTYSCDENPFSLVPT